jgi:hypothetical protein
LLKKSRNQRIPATTGAHSEVLMSRLVRASWLGVVALLLSACASENNATSGGCTVEQTYLCDCGEGREFTTCSLAGMQSSCSCGLLRPGKQSNTGGNDQPTGGGEDTQEPSKNPDGEGGSSGESGLFGGSSGGGGSSQGGTSSQGGSSGKGGSPGKGGAAGQQTTPETPEQALPLDVLQLLFCGDTLGAFSDRAAECFASTAASNEDVASWLSILESLPLDCTAALNLSTAMGRITFDAKESISCRQDVSSQIEQFTCGKYPLLSFYPPLWNEKACEGVIVGKQGQNKPCRHSYECAAGLACLGHSAKSDGICSAPSAIGKPCGSKGSMPFKAIPFEQRQECKGDAYCSSGGVCTDPDDPCPIGAAGGSNANCK